MKLQALTLILVLTILGALVPLYAADPKCEDVAKKFAAEMDETSMTFAGGEDFPEGMGFDVVFVDPTKSFIMQLIMYTTEVGAIATPEGYQVINEGKCTWPTGKTYKYQIGYNKIVSKKDNI